MQRNAQEIKEKITRFIRIRGPSLPVHISKEAGLSILFTSAFLSELLSEKAIKMSEMRVGSSPLYFIQGQEPQLEKFGIENLKGKEKEALLLIKEKKFLSDKEQEPATRVALQSLRDFAMRFTKNSEIYWKYFLADEKEFYVPIEKPKKAEEIVEELKQETQKQIIAPEEIENKIVIQKIEESSPTEINETKKPLDIFDKKEIPKKQETKEKKVAKKKPEKKAPKKTTASQKVQEKFFDKVKEFLSEKQADILEIISANKSELILKIRTDSKEKILIAYNQKKITEKEIIQAHKKSKEYSLPYLIMSLGEMPKKLSELIEALKTLAEIEKIE